MSTHSRQNGFCIARRHEDTACCRQTLIRKTRLLRKIGPMAMRSSVASKIALSRTILRWLATNDLEIAFPNARAASHRCLRDPGLGSISSLRCQKSRMPTSSRSDACETVFCFADDCWWRSASARLAFGYAARFVLSRLAEPKPEGRSWWSQTGSNRRPPACKAGALPAELWPLRRVVESRPRPWRLAEPKLAARAKAGGPGKT